MLCIVVCTCYSCSSLHGWLYIASKLLQVLQIDRVHGYWLSKRLLVLIETVPFTCVNVTALLISYKNIFCLQNVATFRTQQLHSGGYIVRGQWGVKVIEGSRSLRGRWSLQNIWGPTLPQSGGSSTFNMR